MDPLNSYRRELRTLHLENKILATLLDKSRTALLAVSAGIWRNAEMNACGLAGAAATVYIVEDTLKELQEYIDGQSN